MTTSPLRSSILGFIGETATSYPEDWCMSFAYIGLAFGVAMYAGLGYWLGGFAGHPLSGAWCGTGFYAYWLAQQAEKINAGIDYQVAMLRDLRSELDA